MLQVSKKFKLTALIAGILCVLSIGVAVSGAYLNTNRDTRKAPERSKSDLKITDQFQLLYETDKVEYYFREDRDVIAVRDKETGYIWKTGIDVPFDDQVKEAKEAVLGTGKDTVDDLAEDYAKLFEVEVDMAKKYVEELAENPIENSMNEIYVAMANSLVTIEYFKGTGESMTITTVSSASKKDSEGDSSITKVENDGSKWKLEVEFGKADIDLVVYITFGEDGEINYSIPYEEITGEGKNTLRDISITPFLGAAGGVEGYYNAEEEKWTDLQKKYLTPGYAFVPDGSGSLIRFQENKAKFSDYEGAVYGEDPATQMYYYDALDDSVPLEDPVMPVFGVSQGDGTQSAFVAYASKGDEYMTIVATPSSTKKNMIRYTYVYPKFNYNTEYYQVTNQAGDTYRKTQDELNNFDVDITYDFLYGDGSDGEPKADYTGMAKAYRAYLIEEGILTVKEDRHDSIPIRIDFLMSDSKKGIFGTEEIVVTTIGDVKEILNKLTGSGITNINSGLMGWQKDGETLSKPNEVKYSKEIGKKSEFKEIIKEFNSRGIDISLSRDFTTINKSMLNYYGNAAKHLNTQYLNMDKSVVLPENAPVKEFGYALPEKSAKWLAEYYDKISEFSSSITAKGISNVLVSTHNSDGSGTTVTETIELFQNAIAKIKEDGATINLDSPNQYLWKYTDRYLQSPVGTSQYVYETDSVPFLQMVLNGTMEVYAPYSNFSFYSTADMLKMIDYNLSPAFVLTEEPSYLLASTTSADYYSTEFEQYKELIGTIYDTVNDALSQVKGYSWDERTVLEDGVIANEYSLNGEVKTVVINYTEDTVTVNDVTVAPESATVIEGGVN